MGPGSVTKVTWLCYDGGGGKFFFYFKLFWPVFCCIFVEDGEFGSIIQLS